jgi:DNA-binding NarL/FixJ family response regulator
LSNPITGATTVVLADDHQILREGLVRLLAADADIEIVAEASNGHEVLDALRRHPVDVLVTDLSMPGMPVMDLIRRVKSEFPEVAVLVLTMHAEEQYALRAFRSGANGYLTKDSAGEQLVSAIRKVASGGVYVTPALAEHLAIGLRGAQGGARHEQLSNREFEVYRLIVSGKRLTDIADELHLSIKTISTHKARIMEKLGVDSTASLVRYGMEHRLFDEPAAAGSEAAPI